MLRRIGQPVPDLAPRAGAARQALDRSLQRALLFNINCIVAPDLVAEGAPSRSLLRGSNGIGIGDPAQEVTLLVVDQQAVEIIGSEATLAPAVEREVEQRGKRSARGFVCPRIDRDIEAKPLVRVAKEGRHRPVSSLSALAKDVAAILHLDQRLEALRQRERLAQVTPRNARQEDDRKRCLRDGATQVRRDWRFDQAAQPDGGADALLGRIVANRIERGALQGEPTTQLWEGGKPLALRVGPQQRRRPFPAGFIGLRGFDERARKAMDERAVAHDAPPDSSSACSEARETAFALASRTRCLKARV